MSINTTTKYIVYDHSGSGVRHHHFSTQNDILNEADGTATPPTTIPAFGIPVMQFNGVDVPFAFMSVNGAADGNHLYTSPGNQTVIVGNTDINILVVYAPPGGIGVDGGPGVWVDAFNVDTGNFSDDVHFIEILTPPTPPDTVDNAKTTEANWEGDVATLNAAEHIRASATIDGGTPFLEWKKIVPVETIVNSKDFNLSANETGEIWFAFYQTPTPPSFTKIKDNALLWQWVDYATMVDGNPHHPMGPEITALIAAVGFANNASYFNAENAKVVRAVAARQVIASSESIAKIMTAENETREE